MKIAFVVGHDPIESGAYSEMLQKTEYAYNKEVATYLHPIADIYYRPVKGSYHTQMKNLSREINKKPYDLVAELHFNMFDGKYNNVGKGTEALYYNGNAKSKKYAEGYCKTICDYYHTDNRGAKPSQVSKDRGFWFLHLMKANALILEPFFGDEIEALDFHHPGVYAERIKEWIEVIKQTK